MTGDVPFFIYFLTNPSNESGPHGKKTSYTCLVAVLVRNVELYDLYAETGFQNCVFSGLKWKYSPCVADLQFYIEIH